MPTLIVNLPGNARGLVLRDRALIGRRPFNTIALPDPSVSRIHAWIGRREGRYVLFDAGSRAGTRVNGQPVTAPRALADRDEIGVGPAVIEYREEDELPGHVEPIDASPPSPVADPYDGGIYFDCACGGPMWVGAEYAGAAGKCRYCGKRLVVPHVSGQTARSASPSGELPNVTARRAPPAPPAPPKPVAPAVPVKAPEPEARSAVIAPRPAPAPAPPPPATAFAAPVAPPEVMAAPAPDVAQVEPADSPPRRSTPILEQPPAPSAKRVEVPSPPPPEPAAIPEPTAGPAATPAREPAHAGPELALCSICQTGITAGEEKATCPSCGLEFHAGCWHENYGCSAYGCDQVNVLAPPEAREPAKEEALAGEVSYGVPGAGDVDDVPTFPWESVLLALSFVAMFLSALGFGVPSAAMGVAALASLVVGRRLRKSLVLVALLVSIVGTVAGYGMSMFWWRGERVWEPWVRRVSEAFLR
jgi:hypothetical protein